MSRPAHRRGRVDRHDLAGDEPIEQMADRGEPLLDARRGELARSGLDPRSDVYRLDRGDRRYGGARISPARVRVADVGAKNSRKRIEARSPATATSSGSADERKGTSSLMRFPPASSRSPLRSTHRSDESHPAPCTDMAFAKHRVAGVREAAPALFPLLWRCPSGGRPTACAQSHANPSALLESEEVARSSVEVRALLLWTIDRLSCSARSPPCPPQPTTHSVSQIRKGNSASGSASCRPA
jgi:hypothetical protein